MLAHSAKQSGNTTQGAEIPAVNGKTTPERCGGRNHKNTP